MNYDGLPENLAQSKPASSYTEASHIDVLKALPFKDRRSFDNAQRGFIATLEPMTIRRNDGSVAVDLSKFDFLIKEAPPTVNPSLWRQAQLNAQNHGLYKVVDGIYQVRSFDIANMTLIKGESGWIIIDPLTSSETSAAALKLANEQLGERKVVAVIHTHSHADHFAGVLGVITPEQAENGEVQVIAPEHFVDESLSENVIAGNAMGRRATYMYGNLLDPSEKGFVTTGLGAVLSLGTTGFVIPNDTICRTGETRTIDGIEFDFQMTPDTEAPAEFVFYLPQLSALCMSEITSHHLHNIYTPRGAQVRDALAWSEQIHESILRYGSQLEVQFASHHWPIWGQSEAIDYLEKQRDLYKYIHDQTMRLANKGFNKEEIAEQIQLPDVLGNEFFNRDYYGTVNHNSRAVYVKYLGYFDGNPATLHPLPRAESSAKYVECMGGIEAIYQNAREEFEKGEYRWVAELLNHSVAVDPSHELSRSLLADTYEQLGYQAESAPWRNFYLCGAKELREGIPSGSLYAASEGTVRGMPLKNLFRALAVRLIPSKVDGIKLSINLAFTDLETPFCLSIDNSVLHGLEGKTDPKADVSLKISSINFKRLMSGFTNTETLFKNDQLDIEGDLESLSNLPSYFDSFRRRFSLVTPQPFESIDQT